MGNEAIDFKRLLLPGAHRYADFPHVPSRPGAAWRSGPLHCPTDLGRVLPCAVRTAKRLRVGNFRVIFEETEAEILVTKIGPGGVYD